MEDGQLCLPCAWYLFIEHRSSACILNIQYIFDYVIIHLVLLIVWEPLNMYHCAQKKKKKSYLFLDN